MNARHVAFNIALVALASVTLHGQVTRTGDEIPLKNWLAPLYWQPTQSEMRDAGRLPDLALIQAVQTPTSNLVFVGITPCRVVDTRVGAGFPSPFGAPTLSALVKRTFPIQASTLCSIPSTALAYSFNVTVVPVATPGVSPLGYLGFLTLYPTGAALPNASTLNNYLGTVVANAAIVPAGDNGSVDAYAHDATEMIVDINGYYVQAAGGSGGTATVSVGTTTTGAPGTQASVTNTGSSTAAILNFSFPQGVVGPEGSQGPIGLPGATGPQGPTGASGSGAVPVLDANNNVLGTALAIGTNGVTVYRNGYIVALNFDGTLTAYPIVYWSGTNCSGTPYMFSLPIPSGIVTSSRIVYFSSLANTMLVASEVVSTTFQANSVEHPSCDAAAGSNTGWPLAPFDRTILGWQLSGSPLRVPGPIKF